MTGTNLPQDDYLKLEKAAEVLTDAEVILLINADFIRWRVCRGSESGHAENR